MICSQNEVTAVLYKAAVGSGLSVGLAQDLAKAGAWLCATGRPGLALSLGVLDSDVTRSDIGAWCNSFDLLASGVVELVNIETPASVEILEAFGHLAGVSYGLIYEVELDDHGGVVVTCQARPDGAVSAQAGSPELTDAISVEAGDLKRAQTLAHKTYVPATDASRLSGAGAGLTDND